MGVMGVEREWPEELPEECEVGKSESAGAKVSEGYAGLDLGLFGEGQPHESADKGSMMYVPRGGLDDAQAPGWRVHHLFPWTAAPRVVLQYVRRKRCTAELTGTLRVEPVQGHLVRERDGCLVVEAGAGQVDRRRPGPVERGGRLEVVRAR